MKDTPFVWQPLSDFFFHIDEEKKHGFERRVLIFVIVVSILSIVYAWITSVN